MSDAADRAEPTADGQGEGTGSPPVKTPAGPVASTPASPTALKNGADDDGGGDAKNDSEAETVVLPGKDDASTSPQRKAIKHDGNEDGKPKGKRASHIAASEAKATPERDTDAKSKKTPKDHTATSSNLSSTRSTPAPEARTASRAGSESMPSKAKSHPDSDSVSRTSASRKRKIASEEGDDKSHKRRQKRDGSLGNAANGAAGDRDRRDKTKTSSTRSESPQPRTRNRALSLKSQSTSSTQKRKKPPPLHVSRGKHDDESSEGSASPHSAAPQLRRLVSGDATATSPAKMPPHKKLRDKSGRTFLARACDGEDAEVVRGRLEERPEDLDIADYAGNTPLQIASLSGRYEIVKILIDAGCKTDCRNVDQDTPLIDAVENGHLEVIRLLLDAGLNPRQTNAKGEELMDLLDTQTDDYDEIKRLLTKARESRRRASDDHQVPHSGKESATTQRPRENLHSPPPLASAASRRRTARSEATRNDLLWVSATSETLREKARMGDDAAVDHILNMDSRCADIMSVLVAARGSHEVSLSLILAIGGPQADPDPIPGERAGQSTPMLAAIGRGNLRVIELLLDQPEFDPTRRLYQEKTYHEISRDRKGANWEDEYKLLRRAYDKQKGRASTGTSPSHAKKVKAEAAGSPERPKSKSEAKETAERKKAALDGRRSQSRPEERHESPERSRQHAKKHLRVPSKPSSREQSIAVSDREASPMRKPAGKKSRGGSSETEAPGAEMPKPRKRLISKRDLNEGDRQRRASMVSVASASSQGENKGTPREPSSQKAKREDNKREESRERSKLSKADKVDTTKKRSRPETESPETTHRDAQASSDIAKKAKRLRVHAEGKPKKKADTEGASLRHKSPDKQAATGGTATQGKELKGNRLSTQSNSSRKASPAPTSTDNSMTKIKEEPDMPSSQLQNEAQAAADAEKQQQEQAAIKAAEQKAMAEKDEAERKAREEAAARAVEQHQREEAERKLKAEQAEAERKAREEEDARKRKEEEEARRIERERLRREQEELQAKRRKEQEEKERLVREKKRLDEERRRLETLPNALRIAAELSPEQAKQASEVHHWLPLYCVNSQQLEIADGEASQNDWWVNNLQVAPILGLTDLDLSQYTAWTKRIADERQRLAIWRLLQVKLTRYQKPPGLEYTDHVEEFRMVGEAREKYKELKSVFWIRHSEFLDIVPRYPHLAGIELKTQPMGMRPLPELRTTSVTSAATPNGLPARPGLPNGYH